jgi:hypothetical protein
MKIFNKVFIGTITITTLASGTLAFAQNAEGRKDGVLNAQTLSCVQTAIDMRDTAIIAAFDAYYPAVKSALQTRQSALKTAWMQTGQKERREAIKAAWDVYSKAIKSARMTMKAAHKATWSKFETDRKACNPKAGGDDKGSLGADNQL